MRQVRGPVFETNSSSCHSISICDKADVLNTLNVYKGTCHIYGGEFGWDENTFYDAATKASYAAVYAVLYGKQEHRDMLEKVIKEQTKAEKVKLHAENSYIDHQSLDPPAVALSVFESEETLRNFIFNPKSYLHTDNDNH